VVFAIADTVAVVAVLDGATTGGAHPIDRVVSGEIQVGGPPGPASYRNGQSVASAGMTFAPISSIERIVVG
jgi:hypothetical protein